MGLSGLVGVKGGEGAEISGAVRDLSRDYPCRIYATGRSRRCQNRSEVWGSWSSHLISRFGSEDLLLPFLDHAFSRFMTVWGPCLRLQVPASHRAARPCLCDRPISELLDYPLNTPNLDTSSPPPASTDSTITHHSARCILQNIETALKTPNTGRIGEGALSHNRLKIHEEI